MKTKNIFSLLAILAMSFSVLSCSKDDDEGNNEIQNEEGISQEELGPTITISPENWTLNGFYDGKLYYNLILGTENEFEVTKADNVADVEIPAYVDIAGMKYVVTKIADSGFFYNDGSSLLASVKIPNSIKSIGEEAFFYNQGLTSIVIPNSVTEIGDYAFYSCHNLQNVTLSENLTAIGEHTFDGCSISSLTIPQNVVSIGKQAFFSSCKIPNLVIPGNVKSIGNAAFSFSDIESLTISEGVTMIDGAFGFCKKLTKVTLPSTLGAIGPMTFYECTALTSVAISEGTHTIGSAAFEGCTSLSSITLPSSIRTIEFNAFYGCKSLTSITLLSTTPPALPEFVYHAREVFEGSTGPIYVPKGSLSNYLEDDIWRRYYGSRLQEMK